jgi:hypothetical protein
MSYSDFVQSQKSQRVWLEESMKALVQFAFISPIHRVKHWNQGSKKRTKCWAKEGECIFCAQGVAKINEFTYGVYHDQSHYSGGGITEVSYLSVTLATHTLFQKAFTEIINDNKNPTDILFEIERGKIKTSTGRPVKGYSLIKLDKKAFVAEKYRPSLLNSEEQEYKWVVPEEVVDFLKDKDGEPISLIDLFLLLKDHFSGIEEKELKSIAVRLVDNNVLDLRRAREKWI